MKYIRCLIMLMIICASSQTHALDLEIPNPEGALEVKVALTAEEGYVDDLMPKLFKEKAILSKRVEMIYPEEIFFASGIITGFGYNSEGKTQLEVQFQFIDGNGILVAQDSQLLEFDKQTHTGYVFVGPREVSFGELSDEGIFIIKLLVEDKVLTQKVKDQAEVTLKRE